MVNRGNWKLVKEYLRYRREVDQLAESSMKVEEGRLRHLLLWADDRHFINAPKIRPAFPEYVLTARLDGKGNPLSPSHVKKVVRTSQRFFKWLITHHREYRSLSKGWIDTIKPPRMTIEPIERNEVTLEEIRAMAQAPVFSIRDRRIKAAAVFLFLSGMRVGAFVTLPLKAVDLAERTVKQWPRLGVKTKFRKHATTYLLPITDLLVVAQSWDEEVRSILGKDGFWFAPFSPETEDIDTGIRTVGKYRDARVRKDLKEWLRKVGLPYHSPHDFRHGHARYAVKRAKDVPALKAVSQNLMHSNLSTTDGIYGILNENDVRGQITAMGAELPLKEMLETSSLASILEQALAEYLQKMHN